MGTFLHPTKNFARGCRITPCAHWNVECFFNIPNHEMCGGWGADPNYQSKGRPTTVIWTGTPFEATHSQTLRSSSVVALWSVLRISGGVEKGKSPLILFHLWRSSLPTHQSATKKCSRVQGWATDMHQALFASSCQSTFEWPLDPWNILSKGVL